MLPVLVLASLVGWAANPEPNLDDALSTSPYADYASFNEDTEEADYARFLQFGRFFGLSAGFGYHSATGNRGLLWNGGFPMVDLRVHYWFDFQFALDIAFSTASHSFDATSVGTVNVSMTYFGVDLKYYFNTANLSAPFTFASPYVILGGGSFSKTEAVTTSNFSEPDSAFGFLAGAGLEFLLAPKKSYFLLEARLYSVGFKDQFSSAPAGSGIDDLTGAFFSVTGSVMFTW